MISTYEAKRIAQLIRWQLDVATHKLSLPVAAERAGLSNLNKVKYSVALMGPVFKFHLIDGYIEYTLEDGCPHCQGKGKMEEFQKGVNNGGRIVKVRMYRCDRCGFEHN